MKNKTISSDRLLMRNFYETDVDSIYSYRSLDSIAKYQYWEPFTKEQTMAFVNQCKNIDLNRIGEWIGLAVIWNEHNKLIGDCAVKVSENIAEIGCNISPEYQNKGIAKEAVTLLLNYCFVNRIVDEVIGITDSENIASIKLMKSVGMTKSTDFEEKVMCKGSWCIEHRYSIKRVAFNRSTT
ncbi:GNAT family N-acetyltransferase [Dysgonomonas sp. ZJ279]|uniref:GNAT family N-acetyltransferase n=1 Tax=Dysgonomonas sp. ZJ279 TaxID=2709796 RepID=UPI0013ED9594|nr:GNAT family protein [Dysgonomonas sp. ZJ279]